MVRERILAEPELFLKTQRQPPASQAGRGWPWSANWKWRWPSCIAPAGGWPKPCRRWMARNRNKRSARSKARAGNSTGWRHESERNRKPNMLSQAQRTAILELSAKGVSKHEIARVLQLSRLSVRKVLRSNSTQVPEIQRAEKAEPYRQQILDLLTSCKGNLVRVHEELTAGGAALSYPALTAFCRRQGIGQTPVVPAGQYHFEPGVEMQHDTSPHAGRSGRQEVQGADRFGGVVLLAHAVLPDQSHVSAIRLQGVSHRRAALHGRRWSSA